MNNGNDGCDGHDGRSPTCGKGTAAAPIFQPAAALPLRCQSRKAMKTTYATTARISAGSDSAGIRCNYNREEPRNIHQLSGCSVYDQLLISAGFATWPKPKGRL